VVGAREVRPRTTDDDARWSERNGTRHHEIYDGVVTTINLSVVMVVWPQLLVGGGGIALVLVGVISAWILVPRVAWRREPPVLRAYFWLLFVGPAAAGSSFLLAAVLRSYLWELTGGIILCSSFAARLVLAQWVRRRYPDDDPVSGNRGAT
jgi:ABC-type amino acid transport system permease subunit